MFFLVYFLDFVHIDCISKTLAESIELLDLRHFRTAFSLLVLFLKPAHTLLVLNKADLIILSNRQTGEQVLQTSLFTELDELIEDIVILSALSGKLSTQCARKHICFLFDQFIHHS